MMKDFVLIFRGVNDDPSNHLSPQQRQEFMTDWQNWMGGIAAQDKLANRGHRLGDEISILKGNVVTDGPYAEIKEMLSGLIVVKADNLAEAKEMAKGCPILRVNGSVEVRSVVVMN